MIGKVIMLTLDRLTTVVFTLVILTIRQGYGQLIKSCEFDSDSCGCKTDKGVLSLKKFADKQVASEKTSVGAVYYWNPCKDFTKGSVSASCIQYFPASGLYYDCGVHTSTTTDVKDGDAIFHMDSAVQILHSTLRCKCGSGDKLEYINEQPYSTYNLVLTSDACCVSSPGSGASSGLSVGSILLIVLVCVIFGYLLVGVVVQTTVRKAQGKERIPNIQMWSAIPGLIRDGFQFTFSGCRSSGYNEI